MDSRIVKGGMRTADGTLDKSQVLGIEIDTNSHCNAGCPLCFRNYKTFNISGKERSIECILADIDGYENLEQVYLVGSYSEPTLHTDFLELVYEIKKRDMAIEICTNGDTHNPEWWRKLGIILNDEDEVYFSVCGSTEELHQTYRINCSLQKLRDNASAMRENCTSDFVQHILFDYNREDLESGGMQEIFNEFSHVHMTKTYYTRDESIYRDNTNVSRLSPAASEDYRRIIQYADTLVDRKKDVEIQCISLEKSLVHIDHKGDIFPCYIWLEESGLESWDQDYNRINNFEYDCCRFCEKNVKKMTELKDCEIL